MYKLNEKIILSCNELYIEILKIFENILYHLTIKLKVLLKIKR